MSMQQVPLVIQQATPFINHFGYLAVFLLLLLESVGLPLPGESTLIAAAFLAALGKLNILIVGVVAVAGASTGSSIGFVIGAYPGRPFLEKYGKYVLLTKKRLDETEKYFNRRGAVIVVVARFIEGLRQLNGLVAGISEMKFKKFIKYNVLGAVIWVALWSSVGYFSGNHIQAFINYQLYFSIAGAIFIIFAILFLSYKHLKSHKRA
jgi:membrane protein DedA with SNARE-associated domain